MKLEYTEHAELKLKERRISKSDIDKILKKPLNSTSGSKRYNSVSIETDSIKSSWIPSTTVYEHV